VHVSKAGLGRDTFGYTGVLINRFVNPVLCPPPSPIEGTAGVLSVISGGPMAAIESSEFLSSAPTHQTVRWITGPGKDSPYAAFLEMTYDVAAGLHTCLDIIHASDLQREINGTADADQAGAPAIGAFDAEKLLRLSLVSTAMLTREAMRRIEEENQPPDGAYADAC